MKINSKNLYWVEARIYYRGDIEDHYTTIFLLHKKGFFARGYGIFIENTILKIISIFAEKDMTEKEFETFPRFGMDRIVFCTSND